MLVLRVVLRERERGGCGGAGSRSPSLEVLLALAVVARNVRCCAKVRRVGSRIAEADWQGDLLGRLRTQDRVDRR